MTLTEYCDTLNLNLKITYHHNRGSRYSARFEGLVEIKADGMLSSCRGEGTSPLAALLDFVKAIQGKTIVLNAAGGDKRREYRVPMSLEVAGDNSQGVV